MHYYVEKLESACKPMYNYLVSFLYQLLINETLVLPQIMQYVIKALFIMKLSKHKCEGA